MWNKRILLIFLLVLIAGGLAALTFARLAWHAGAFSSPLLVISCILFASIWLLIWSPTPNTVMFTAIAAAVEVLVTMAYGINEGATFVLWPSSHLVVSIIAITATGLGSGLVLANKS
jgi:hypothetical protein